MRRRSELIILRSWGRSPDDRAAFSMGLGYESDKVGWRRLKFSGLRRAAEDGNGCYLGDFDIIYLYIFKLLRV